MSSMNDELRNIIWERDNNTCQYCRKSLLQRIEPLKEIDELLSEIKEVDIYQWTKICWKCGAETTIVTYLLEISENYHIGSIENLDMELMKRYQFVKRKYSHTMGTEVIANTCIHCNSLQGNRYILKDIIEFYSEGSDMREFIIGKINTIISVKDLYDEEYHDEFQPYYEKLSTFGHVHHIDKNRKNNNIENLILLCAECHRQVHNSKVPVLLEPKPMETPIVRTQKHKYVKCTECGGRARVNMTEMTGICKKCKILIKNGRILKERLSNLIDIEEEKNRRRSDLYWKWYHRY